MTASVAVVLDTTPPTLTVDAIDRIVPPEDWIVTIEASEDVGFASAYLRDALGVPVNLGMDRDGTRRLLVSVPTVGVAAGPGSLILRICDEVLNEVMVEVPVMVVRPDAHEVELTLSSGYDQDLGLEGGFSIEVGLDRSHAVTLEVSS